MNWLAGGASTPRTLTASAPRARSASPRRLALLTQIGVKPDAVLPSEIDETPRRGESPRALAERLALEKALAASVALANEPFSGHP